MSQKRSFAVDTSTLAAERPVLDEGYYAAQLGNSGVTMGSADNIYQLLQVQPRTRKNTKTKKFDPIPGEYAVRGQFTYGATLFSEKAKQTLQRDEPKIFGGQFYISFNDEFRLDKDNNQVYQNFLTALDLSGVDFDSQVDFEWDEDIVTEENILDLCAFRNEDSEEDIKEKIEGYMSFPDMEAALNSVVYYRKLFAIVAESVNGQNVKVKVKKQQRRNSSLIENVIACDSGFCGILAYTDGCEFDLND